MQRSQEEWVFRGTSEKALINSLREKINEFNAKLNIPSTLKEFGINEDEFKEKVAHIAELAVGDACTGSNPRAIDPASNGETSHMYILRNRS